jgi:hypothetical protein
MGRKANKKPSLKKRVPFKVYGSFEDARVSVGKQPKIKNPVMYERVCKGEAINLAGFPRNKDGDYILRKIKKNADYCDLSTWEWILSMGENKKTKEILASTTAKFYNNKPDGFECVWLG